MKKTLTLMLIFAYLNCYLGCYKTVPLPGPDISSNDQEISVFTKDGRNIIFDSDMYRFKNDSLDGIGIEIIDDDEQEAQRMQIAVADISKVEAIEVDLLLTYAIIVLITLPATVWAAAFAIAAHK